MTFLYILFVKESRTMEDGKVEIGVNLNTTELNKQTKDAEGKLKKFGENVKKTAQSGNISKLATSFGAVGAAIGVAITAAKKINAEIQKSIELATKQAKAEKLLEVSARNNPFLDKESVSRLKNYASEFQKISTVGDEEIIPFMSQLANTGRTEAEIQKIMKTSLDLSASGIMSLDSAVMQLNATFSGNIGTLGRQISELKDLTAEELKSGKAIEIVAGKYKGLSEEMAKLDYKTQLKNAKGDIGEKIGEPFRVASENMAKRKLEYLKNVDDILSRLKDWKFAYNEIAEAAEEIINTVVSGNKTNETLDAWAKLRSGQATQEDYNLIVKQTTDKIEENTQAMKTNAEVSKELWGQDIPESIDEYKNKIIELREELNKLYEKENSSALSKYVMDSNGKMIENPALKDAQKKINSLEDTIANMSDDLEFYEGRQRALNKELEKADTLWRQQQKTAEATRKEAEATAKAKRIEENNQKASDLLKTYNETITKAQKEIEIRRQEGEVISETEEKQKMLEVRKQAYLNLIINSNGLITGVSKREQAELKKILDLEKELTDEYTELKSALSEVSIDEDKKLSDALKEQLEEIDRLETEALKNGLDENTELYKEYVEKRKELAKQITEAEKAETLEQANAISESINNALDSLGSTIGKVSEMVTKNAENEALVETANIEKQYAQGILSAEEYAKAKERITKEQAEKEYKIQMWVWASQVAQATGSIAQSMLQVLSDSTISSTTGKIAMMSLAGALGAAQLSSIIGAKPIPPSFENGGVVGGFGGATDGHDNTYAHVRTGEMILNARNQQALWKTINGQNPGSKGVSLSVKNYASGVASVTPQITEDGITLLINKTVSGGLESGQFNKSLTYANVRMKGTRYLN